MSARKLEGGAGGRHRAGEGIEHPDREKDLDLNDEDDGWDEDDEIPPGLHAPLGSLTCCPWCGKSRLWEFLFPPGYFTGAAFGLLGSLLALATVALAVWAAGHYPVPVGP